jgi:hypothetical protein
MGIHEDLQGDLVFLRRGAAGDEQQEKQKT